ncbi:ABC transporter substrate-binding protein [Roseibium aggregatum]|nr:ABC transporter substrate-binding protein [Roseibium aggregatum]
MHIDLTKRSRRCAASLNAANRCPQGQNLLETVDPAFAMRRRPSGSLKRRGTPQVIARVFLSLMAVFALVTDALAQETITIGVTTTGVPFTFVDTVTQQPTGAMVDLAKAIAHDNALKAQFEIMAFPALIPALKSGKIDLISAGMFVKDERKKIVNFSTPVYAFGETMFVAANDPLNYKIGDLKGEVVGAQIGSTFAHSLQGLGIFRQVKLYDSIADIMRDVKLGRIKAGFGDQPIVAYQLSQNSALGVRMVEDYQPIDRGQVSLAVAKDNPELSKRLEASIAKFKENGELAKIFARYGL